MESNLRPMSLGEILDRTAQLYREHFLLFAGIYAVYSGVVLVLSLVQIGLTSLLKGSALTVWVPVLLGFIAVIEAMFLIIFAGAVIAAINRAVAWVHLGEPATIRGAYLSTLPQLGRYIWLMILTTFFICAPLLLLLILIPLAIFTVPGLSPGGFGLGALGVLVILLLVLFFIAWLVYAIIMGLRYSLAVPACVVENLKARKALHRSIELSKGSRGRIFFLGLLIFVIQFGLVLLTQVFFVAAVFNQPSHILPAWMQALQQIVGFFTNTFLGPIWATGIALFYYDQRVRREGYDIEWMMQAAGLTAPAPALSAESGATAEAAVKALENGDEGGAARVDSELSPEWMRHRLDDLESVANRGLWFSIAGLTFSIVSLVISTFLIPVAYVVLFFLGIHYNFKAIRILDKNPECEGKTSARKKAHAGRIICWTGVSLLVIEAIVHLVRSLGVR